MKDKESLYLPVDTYQEAMEHLEKVSTRVLITFQNHSTGIKDEILRNFIARAIVSLRGMSKLYEAEDYQDCWVLFRGILDRLFHLRALIKDNSFMAFDKWSFKKQYDFINKIRNDPDFNQNIDIDYCTDIVSQRERYYSISRERFQWQRPNTSTVAREMELLNLYKYGYDYVSTLAQPMANDGQEDYQRITNAEGKDFIQDERVVLHYSCMIVALILQESINASGFDWKGATYDFVEEYIYFLKNQSSDYKSSYKKILKVDADDDLFKKASRRAGGKEED